MAELGGRWCEGGCQGAKVKEGRGGTILLPYLWGLLEEQRTTGDLFCGQGLGEEGGGERGQSCNGRRPAHQVLQTPALHRYHRQDRALPWGAFFP